MWVYAGDREDGRLSVAVQGTVEGMECFERDKQEWQEGGSQWRDWQLETSRLLEGMVGSQMQVAEQRGGREMAQIVGAGRRQGLGCAMLSFAAD